MKLYTEEQVRLLLDLAKLKINGQCYSKETLLEQVAPIELPSDEEIHNKGRYSTNIMGFLEGGRWVIEKLKNNAR